MSGALMQLVAQGNQNTVMGIRNVAHEYDTYESQGLSPVIIERRADVIIPEYLELHFFYYITHIMMENTLNYYYLIKNIIK